MNNYLREQKAGPCSVLPASRHCNCSSIPLTSGGQLLMVPTWGVQQTVSATSQRECQVEVIWLVGLLGWCGWHLSLLMMLEKPFVPEKTSCNRMVHSMDSILSWRMFGEIFQASQRCRPEKAQHQIDHQAKSGPGMDQLLKTSEFPLL